MSCKDIIIYVFFVFCLLPHQCLAEMQKITLPVTIDYPLMRSLLVAQAFTEPEETVTLANEGGGCISLTASQPQISEQDGLIRLELFIHARAGTPLANNCFAPVAWQGILVLNQQPVLNPITWQLSFKTVSSEVLRPDRQPAMIAAILWNMIEPQITSYLSGITIDLMPPVAEMKQFLLPVFPEDRRLQTEKMLLSMSPAEVNVRPHSINIQISAEVENVFDLREDKNNKTLDHDDLRRTVADWEKWDSLLLHVVTMLTQQILTEDEKQALINVILDVRYGFITAMADKTIQGDIVRQQFVNAWQVISPIFRRHLLQGNQLSQALGYLAFVSSADALLVFDKLGPTLGLEISTGGLVRLMHMLNADPDLLQYNSDINTELKKLFELEQDNKEPPASSMPSGSESSESLLDWLVYPFSLELAYAAEKQPKFSEILQWKVPKSGVNVYISRVNEVLMSATQHLIKKNKIPVDRQKMFRTLIPAMAWQESCFRQFTIKKKKLTYLISYNQSSVGLMQVNERVWRGLYDLNRLRWDIVYNAKAGSEIAALYLNKYALRDGNQSKTIDDDTLARVVYAIYNGGPSHSTKFFQRMKNKKLFQSDKLFWEKLLLVKSGKTEQVSTCLIGG